MEMIFMNTEYSETNKPYKFDLNLPQSLDQFVIFKPLSYCFKETIRFDVKATFVIRPTSRLIK